MLEIRFPRKEVLRVVLHKQLRVLNRGTPCEVYSVTNQSTCVYKGVSEDILRDASEKYRDSFVKRVSLKTEPTVALEILVKCREV